MQRSPPFFFSLLLLAAGAAAQEVPVVLEFSFSNPGARAMGVGGAFAALADDATAAFTNPAGLAQLTRPEVSIEGRLWSYSTPFTLGGRFDGSEPSGILLDDTSGLRTAESSQDLAGLSFLSFVYPKEDWSLAFYRHQSARFEFRSRTQGLFERASPPYSDRRQIDFQSFIDLDLVNYGFSVAYQLSEGLSLGLGISYLDGRFSSQSDIFFPTEESLPEGFFGPHSYNQESLLLTNLLTINDSDWTFNLGFLWHASRQWSVGGFFRRGPEFLLEETTFSGPFLRDIPEGTVVDTAESPIGFPDVFGLGVAFKSEGEALTLLAEWDHVRYSTILDSLDPDEFDSEAAALDDGDEFHAGLEYVFLDWVPLVAIRVGTWLEPDHRFRNVGNPLGRALFRAGDDQWHFTAGFGIAFQRFQIDLGFDLSDVIKTASVSTVFSF
jgi:hypothetical protein